MECSRTDRLKRRLAPTSMLKHLPSYNNWLQMCTHTVTVQCKILWEKLWQIWPDERHLPIFYLAKFQITKVRS